jgi:hypothetical protein
MNRRHMTDDHHGRTAGRATLLLRAMDEIFGTLRSLTCPAARHGHRSYQGTRDASHARPQASQNPGKPPFDTAPLLQGWLSGAGSLPSLALSVRGGR